MRTSLLLAATLAVVPLSWAAPSSPIIFQANDDLQAPAWSDSVQETAEKAQEGVNQLLGDAMEALTTEVDADAIRPGHSHGIIDFSDYTILEILNASLHRHHEEHDKATSSDDWAPSKPWKFFRGKPSPEHAPLHRLAWIVNHSSEAQKALGKDGITLLAPDDAALSPPHPKGKRPRSRRPPPRAIPSWKSLTEGESSVRNRRGSLEGPAWGRPEMYEALESRMNMEHQPPHPFHMRHLESDYAEESRQSVDEDRKAKFAKIVAYILRYHTLPFAATEHDLVGNSTLPTTLSDDDEPLRVKVEPSWTFFPFPHPSLTFNDYAKKRGPTLLAKNGVIHFISGPLFPPLSPLNGLFLFPQGFSTLTSSIQKVGLADALLPTTAESLEDLSFEESSSSSSLATGKISQVHEMLDEMTKENGRVFTVFAPTNLAFGKLGPKILAFLHSPLPLSKKILKYVLAYHVVPDIAFYSDYVNNQTALTPYLVSRQVDVSVPQDWVEAGQAWPTSHILEEEDIVESAAWKLPLPGLPKRPERGGEDHRDRSPPGRGPPGRGPPHREPEEHGPIRGPDREHRRTLMHHKANITKYELPTLLATSGVNKNGTLKVAVVEYRIFGKGPLRRSLIILPHHHPHRKEKKEEESDSSMDIEDVKAKCHGRGRKGPHGPHPVKVWKKDVPARKGSLHLINSLLRPPFFHHGGKGNATASSDMDHEGRHGHHGMSAIFRELFD